MSFLTLASGRPLCPDAHNKPQSFRLQAAEDAASSTTTSCAAGTVEALALRSPTWAGSNLQAIIACTCHCRPTEVYRGPEGHEDHRLTERTLAETDPGAADFIMSHKNLMQPLEDLERGMGVPEEDRPYMKQYHGYMLGRTRRTAGPWAP
eukprot:jgi/Tetstr1/426857/TSEL_017071.t1